jgi:hypothetical protein
MVKALNRISEIAGLHLGEVQSGVIQPPESLAGVIERITRDLQQGNEDPDYGVGFITNPTSGEGGSSADNTARDFMGEALAGIATALGLKVIGM